MFRLLIAEAERAAKALEVAALKSPLAKASLSETRKLIAEANLSLKSIESRQSMSQESVVDSYFNSTSDGSKKHLQINTTTAINKVNGFYNLSSIENGDEINQYKMKVKAGSEAAQGHLPPCHLERIDSDRAETIALYRSDLDSRNQNDSKIGSTRTRKWVRGRLIEVED